MRLGPLLFLALALAACDRAAAPDSGSGGGLDAGQTPDAGATKTRLFDAGKEPRAPISFAFDVGRVERFGLELTSVLSQGEKTLSDERVTVKLSVKYIEPHVVEMLVLDATTTAPDVKGATTAGMLLTQRFHPLGATDIPHVLTPKLAHARSADYIHGALMQLASGLLPVAPAEPVGEGARWGHEDLRFELLSRRGDELVVERRSERKGIHKLAGGEIVNLSDTQTYRIEMRPGGIARRIEAVLVNDQPNGTVITTRLRFEPEPAK
ncbi:MAG: hypothetical protein HUU21_17490 [Polyangiaceae bacterium]|nr:hypothetical protein [Polyangiaceae bacterium]NUQ75345.1 hypothetical protein [Polyangiaceae bacterium]